MGANVTGMAEVGTHGSRSGSELTEVVMPAAGLGAILLLGLGYLLPRFFKQRGHGALIGVLILNGLILPISCFPALRVITIVVPVPPTKDFTIENRTNALVRVTPIGAIGEDGQRYPLHTVHFRHLRIPRAKRGDFQIEPGEKLTVYYEWGEMNFSELVFENGKGDLRQIVVNPNPTKGQYVIPPVTEFVIKDLNSLAVPMPNVEAAYRKGKEKHPILLPNLAAAIPAITFGILFRRYRRLRRSLESGARKRGCQTTV